jgi:PBSX family phage terminase large subunit
MSEIDISYKFQPLFELLNDNFAPEVDTVIMTGGRYSLKSSTVSIFSLAALVEYQWNILYTRYTNMSIVDSVKPEVSDKIEMLGYENRVTDTNAHIETSKNRIAFKGIKTGSSIQTANLKSLTGFNCFIVDEAEEIPDFETFKKVFYSIRSEHKRNLTILILNPTNREHWIFQEFFDKRGLEGGENCIKENVMYIHTSYLDADQNRIPKNILADYNRMKVDNPTMYENVVLGGWIKDLEGLLLPLSSLRFDDLSNINSTHYSYRFSVGDPADKGGDKYAMPFMFVDFSNKKLTCYVKDCICNEAGIMANTGLIVNKLHQYMIDECIVEANGVGLASVLTLKEKIQGLTKLLPFTSTEPKEVRILSNYEFIQKHFVFDSNYKNNPQYYQFIKDLTSYYIKGDNKHKMDAIDVLCSAAKVLKVKFGSVIY